LRDVRKPTASPIPGQETHYHLACVENGERVAFALHGVTERLFIRQAIEVVGGGSSVCGASRRPSSRSNLSNWTTLRSTTRRELSANR